MKTRRGTKATIAVVLLAAAAVAFTVHAVWFSGMTASARLRQSLPVDTSTPEAVRAGVLALVPVGTSEMAVVAYLEAHGFGDGPYLCLARSAGEVRCTVWTDDASTWRSTPASWYVTFRLDESSRLRDVEVKQGFLVL